MKFFCLLPFLLFSFTGSVAQQNNFILWSPHFLSWRDFKKPPDSTDIKSTYAAATQSWLQQKYKLMPDNEIHFTIAAWFIPARSWVKSKSDHGLRHEQYHFNLAELYARKIRRILINTTFTMKNYKRDIADLFLNFHNKYRSEQKRYDEETLHSRDKSKQIDWMDSIDDEMKALAKFSDTLVVVKMQ